MSRLDRTVLGLLVCLWPVLWLVPVAIRLTDPILAVQGTFRHRGGGDRLDPWGHPLVEKELTEVVPAGTKIMLPPPSHYAYEIYSCGPDGIDAGGAGDDVVLVGKGIPACTPEQFARAELLVRIAPILLKFFPLLFLIPSYLLGRLVLRSKTPLALTLIGTGSIGAALFVAIPMGRVFVEAIPQTSVLDPRLSLALALAALTFSPGAASHFFHRKGGPGWTDPEPAGLGGEPAEEPSS